VAEHLLVHAEEEGGVRDVQGLGWQKGEVVLPIQELGMGDVGRHRTEDLLMGITKLGSHGRKDITKVMAITNRNGKGDQSSRVRGIGYLNTCKYPAG
jgi:hypothetical protein